MRNGLPMREAVAFWSSYDAFDCTVSRRTACKRPAWSARMSRSRCAFLSRTTSGASDGALINSRTAWQPRRVASSAHRKARLKEPALPVILNRQWPGLLLALLAFALLAFLAGAFLATAFFAAFLAAFLAAFFTAFLAFFAAFFGAAFLATAFFAAFLATFLAAFFPAFFAAFFGAPSWPRPSLPGLSWPPSWRAPSSLRPFSRPVLTWELRNHDHSLFAHSLIVIRGSKNAGGLEFFFILVRKVVCRSESNSFGSQVGLPSLIAYILTTSSIRLPPAARRCP